MWYMKRFAWILRHALLLCLVACSFLLTACSKADPRLGQKLKEAVFNTLTGMGTVFVVLIFISLLISCFKFIYAYENKMKESNHSVNIQTPVTPTSVVEIEEEEEDLTDDLELVAVITAAIAASTGSSPSGLVVRSIKRAPASKWKKA